MRWILFVILWLSASVAFAQTTDQADAPARNERLAQELYAQAHEQYAAAQYARSEALLRRAILAADSNILRLSLGLALAHQSRCDDARREYERAKEAPAVVEPTEQEVNARIERALNELAATCAQNAMSPSTTPSESAPTSSSAPTATPVQTPVVVAPESPSSAPASTTASVSPLALRNAGIATLASGVAVFTGAILMDVFALGDALDDADAARESGNMKALQAAQDHVDAARIGAATLYGVGAAAVLAGAGLWIASAFTHEDAAPASVSFDLTARGLRLRF